MLLVHEPRRTRLYTPHQIGQCSIWPQTDEQMQMIGHIIDGYQLLSLTGDNAGDIFLKFVVTFGFDEVLSAFDSEHNTDLNLSVGVGHDWKMPLLTELGNLFPI